MILCYPVYPVKKSEFNIVELMKIKYKLDINLESLQSQNGFCLRFVK